LGRVCAATLRGESDKAAVLSICDKARENALMMPLPLRIDSPCNSNLLPGLLRNWPRLVLFILAMVLFLPPMAVRAQDEDGRVRLDKLKAELTSIEAALQNQALRDDGLQKLRAQVDPVLDKLRTIVNDQTPRFEGIKSRLEQLGPKPDASKNQTESEDVTRERAEQDKLRAEVDDLLRFARVLIVQGEQLQARVSDRRRTLFTKELLDRSYSIVSPQLWSRVLQVLPQELNALRYLFENSLRAVWDRLDRTKMGLLAGFAGLVLLGSIPLRRLVHRFDQRDPAKTNPTRRERAMAACRIMVTRAVLAVVPAFVIIEFLSLLGLLPDQVSTIASTLIWGMAIIFLIRGLAKAVLAPEAPQWRMFGEDEASVQHLMWLAISLPTISVIGKLAESLGEAIVVALVVTVAIRGIVAVLMALATLQSLRSMQIDEEVAAKDGSDGTAAAPAVATTPAVAMRLPFRLIAGSAAVFVLAAALLGYVALAAFVTDQFLWVVCVVSIVAVVLVLIDDVIGQEISADGRLGRQIQATVGVRRGSLQQLGILATGLMRLTVFVVAAFLLLAPWGLDGADAIGTLKAAFFGFSIAGVTVSLSAIVIAIVLFLLGFTATRAVQSWLDTKYLPHTGLDLGLRNSIKTILGYIGIIITTGIALSQLGFSLDKLTLVAGALSVGIGFGLQSIVQNFVSGLILLWERPIRVGDWVDVGAEQGIVKRINVRATEIETFDRASLIVPNAEFISGRVKNWMHNDRMGRILIPIGVVPGADPDAVRKLLLDAALGHREVLSEPKPRVFFMKLGNTTLDFELRCFVDVDAMLSVRSELLFDIFARLRALNIEIPIPKYSVEFADLERLGGVIAAQIPSRDGPG
jgi:potassium-dependent mechanosensitive channel